MNTILICSALLLLACAVYGAIFQCTLSVLRWMFSIRSIYNDDYNFAVGVSVFWPVTVPLAGPILLIGYSIYGGNLAAKWIGRSVQNVYATLAARKYEKPATQDEDEL